MAQIVRMLRKFAEVHSADGDEFRARAYSRAANLLLRMDVQKMSHANLLALPGIGKGIADKVIEFKQTGRVKELKHRREKLLAIKKLTHITGVGPQMAKKLVAKGIKSVNQLKKAVKNGTDCGLTKAAKLGLEHYDDLKRPIPRSEIASFGRRLATIRQLKFEIVGSYRRRASESGDVDILIWDINHKTHQALMKILADRIVGVLTSGPKKRSFLVRLYRDGRVRQLDLLFVPRNQRFAALNYFTGSKEHNIQLRAKARELGMILNEKHLLGLDGRAVRLRDERDIYDILGVRYLAPHRR